MASAASGSIWAPGSNSASASADLGCGQPEQIQGNVLPGQPPQWASDSVWRSHVTALASFPSRISILELCAGTGAASLAAQLLLGPDKVHLAGAWDLDPALKGIYDVIHGAAAAPNIHLGQPAGDILATSIHTFPNANVLVAGPPCPPFSSCGKRLAMDDPRARPFERCIEVIVELDKRQGNSRGSRGNQDHGHPLMFFLLENVLGINFKEAGSDEQPALDTLCAELRSKLGKSWLVQPMQLNAMDYGLPQSRRRIYIVGRKIEEFYMEIPHGHPPHFEKRVSPAALLDLQDSWDPRQLTELQEAGIDAWKALYEPAMMDEGNRGSFAFVEMGRDPSGRTVWGRRSSRAPPAYDKCQCLRASGPQIRVFALGEGVGQLSLDRNLRVRERAALQGFPPAVGNLPYKERDGCRIFGNAMAVPVVGSLLAQELKCIQARWASATCVHPAPSTPPTRAYRAPRADRPDSPGPATQVLLSTWYADNDQEEDVLRGQRAAVVLRASDLWHHWESGRSGRLPKRPCPLQPEDHAALAHRDMASRRQRTLGKSGALSSLMRDGRTASDTSGTPDVQEAPSLQANSPCAPEQPSAPGAPQVFLGIPAEAILPERPSPEQPQNSGWSIAAPLSPEVSTPEPLDMPVGALC